MNELSLTTLACFILICGEMPIILVLTVFLLKFTAWTEIQENNVIGPILGTRMEYSETPRSRCRDPKVARIAIHG